MYFIKFQIAFFLGIILNELVNFVLKNWLCEPRPLVRNVTYQEYGMPSSHSQFMWFFATYCALFVIIRYTGSTCLKKLNNHQYPFWCCDLINLLFSWQAHSHKQSFSHGVVMERIVIVCDKYICYLCLCQQVWYSSFVQLWFDNYDCLITVLFP